MSDEPRDLPAAAPGTPVFDMGDGSTPYANWCLDPLHGGFSTNLMGLADGLLGGGDGVGRSFENFKDAMEFIGYTPAQIADRIAQAMSVYNGYLQIWNGSLRFYPNARKYQPAFFRDGGDFDTFSHIEIMSFVNPETGEISNAIKAVDPSGADRWGGSDQINIPIPDAIGEAATAALLDKFDWITTENTQFPTLPGDTSAATIAFESLLNQIYLLAFNQYGPVDAMETLLLLQPSFLTRFAAVGEIFSRLIAYCRQASLDTGVPYFLRDLMSNTPIDPDMKLYVARNSTYYNILGHMPTRIQAFYMPLANGDYPLVLAGTPGSQVSAWAAEFRGKLNPKSALAWRTSTIIRGDRCFAGSLLAYRILSRYPMEIINMKYPGVGAYPDPVTGLPKYRTGATLFAAPALWWHEADGKTPWFPIVTDDNDWNDIKASIAAGKMTQRQVGHVTESLLEDPVAMDLLITNPQQSIIQSFLAEPNAQALLDAYQATHPKANP